MKIQQMKELAGLMRENGLTLIEITEGGDTLRLERKGKPEASSPAQNGVVLPTAAAPVTAPVQEHASGTEVKSPMVGVFYAAPSPEAEPYAAIGSRVKKGDTLCIVEAMKLLNEISAECSGEITEICAASGQVVEYGQVLFRIKQEAGA